MKSEEKKRRAFSFSRKKFPRPQKLNVSSLKNKLRMAFRSAINCVPQKYLLLKKIWIFIRNNMFYYFLKC